MKSNQTRRPAMIDVNAYIIVYLKASNAPIEHTTVCYIGFRLASSFVPRRHRTLPPARAYID
jgi:hypothetical protein